MWPFRPRPTPPVVKRPPRPTQLHPKRFTDADLRRMRLESELDHAQVQAAEARDEVERISSEHLQAVLRLPSAERAARVDDPELVMADRQAVVVSLAGDEAAVGGWRPTLGGARKDALLRFWGRNRHRVPAMIQAIVLLGPLCAFGAMAYSNTGAKWWASQNMTIDFASPNGSHYTGRIDVGDEVVVVRHHGRFFVRRWEIRQGYALGEVD